MSSVCVSVVHCNKRNLFNPNRSRAEGPNVKNPTPFSCFFQLSICIPSEWRWWKDTDIHNVLRKPFSYRYQKSEFFYAQRFSSLRSKCADDSKPPSAVERTKVLCTNRVRISTNVWVRARSGRKTWFIPYSEKSWATERIFLFFLVIWVKFTIRIQQKKANFKGWAVFPPSQT